MGIKACLGRPIQWKVPLPMLPCCRVQLSLCTHTHTHTHMHTHMYTHMHMHSHTHMHTHTHTHTHTDTCYSPSHTLYQYQYTHLTTPMEHAPYTHTHTHTHTSPVQSSVRRCLCCACVRGHTQPPPAAAPEYTQSSLTAKKTARATLCAEHPPLPPPPLSPPSPFPHASQPSAAKVALAGVMRCPLDGVDGRRKRGHSTWQGGAPASGGSPYAPGYARLSCC